MPNETKNRNKIDLPDTKIPNAKHLNKQLMIYKKENEKLTNEFRDFRHHVLNIMHGINGFIELEDWGGLKDYFYQALEIIKPKDTNLSTIEKLENPSLKKLLKAKYKKSHQAGIAFKFMANQNILTAKELLYQTDLCQVISTLLNQAIEEALDAKNKKVSIYLLGNKNALDIIIESTSKEIPHASAIDTSSSAWSKYPDILYNVFVQHQTFVRHLQIKKHSNRCD
ncbi:MAG: hypothetical protein AAGU27_06165 [Dehalobacterium sp.]